MASAFVSPWVVISLKVNPPEPQLPEVESGIEPPPYLSPSSIATWQQCPLKFKYSRIDKIVDPPTEATVLGNFVHDALEMLFQCDPENRTLTHCKTILRQLWADKWEAEAAAVTNGNAQAMHEMRWKAWWCLENYFAMEDPTEISLDGIETLVNTDIDGVMMKGFIDRWSYREDGTILIGDYKTGKTPKPSYEGDKFQQLYIYAHLLGQIEKAEVSEVELLYLKDGVRLKREVLPNILKVVAKEVSMVREQVEECCETGEFPAIKHTLCGWCSYKPFCPAWV